MKVLFKVSATWFLLSMVLLLCDREILLFANVPLFVKKGPPVHFDITLHLVIMLHISFNATLRICFTVFYNFPSLP